MKATSVLSSLLFIGYGACAQIDHGVIGKRFPEVKSISLAGNEVSLPEDIKGKIALITIAFIEEGQPFIDSWAEPFLEKFYGKEGFSYYEVPMMNIPQPAARQFIDDGMRAGIEQQMHPNVVTYYGELREYRKTLKMPNIGTGYAYLVDKNGIIRFRGEGKMTQEDWESLNNIINDLKGI